MATCDMCLKSVPEVLVNLRDCYETKAVKSVCRACEKDCNAALDRMQDVQRGFVRRFLNRFVNDRRESAMKALVREHGERPDGTYRPKGDIEIPKAGPALESGIVTPEWAAADELAKQAAGKERERVLAIVEKLQQEAKAKGFSRSWMDALDMVELAIEVGP